jgi:hypothetical protein
MKAAKLLREDSAGRAGRKPRLALRVFAASSGD